MQRKKRKRDDEDDNAPCEKIDGVKQDNERSSDAEGDAPQITVARQFAAIAGDTRLPPRKLRKPERGYIQ